MGDIHRGIAEAVNLFFVGWRKLLLDVFEEAKKAGSIKSDTNCIAISNLIMSTIEGAILISKTSKDLESFIKTMETLKSVIYFYKA
jgi:hypothetical protein